VSVSRLEMDVEGNVIDQPSEPAASRMCDRGKSTPPIQSAKQEGASAWVYMGAARITALGAQALYRSTSR